MKRLRIVRLSLLSVLLVLPLLSDAHPSSLADAALPDGAAARLGVGRLTGNLAFSPDGRWLAEGTSVGVVLRDTESMAPVSLFGHCANAVAVAFSADGELLASGFEDQSIRLWNVATGREVRTLIGHTEEVTSVAFSPDGSLLASGSDDDTITLWDVDAGSKAHVLTGHASSVRSVAFSSDGRLLVSGSSDETLKLWDVNAGAEMRTLGGHSDTVYSVAFSPDGEFLASGSADKTAILWDATTGKETQELAAHNGTVRFLAFSPDGARLITYAGATDWTIRLWDVSAGRARLLDAEKRIWATRSSYCLQGAAIAGVENTDLTFWDAEAMSVLRTIDGKTSIHSLAVSPDGNTIAIGLFLMGLIRLYDVATGSELGQLAAGSTVAALAFHPDGQVIAAAYGQTVALYDLGAAYGQRAKIGGAATGRIMRLRHDGDVTSIEFSPDGQLLASASVDTTVKLWNAETGEDLLVLAGYSGSVNGISFSPDGRSLASCSEDGAVRLWELPSGEEYVMLADRGASASAVAFNQDGSLLASGFVDGTVKVWNVSTGMKLASYTGHCDEILSVNFSPDGQTLASASKDATILLWDIAEADTQPPVVSRVAFPKLIAIDEAQHGLVKFEDSDGDVAQVRFEILEGDPATIGIQPGMSFDPEVRGQADGAFRFTVNVSVAQTVTLRLTLIDAAGVESEPYEFTFEVE